VTEHEREYRAKKCKKIPASLARSAFAGNKCAKKKQRKSKETMCPGRGLNPHVSYETQDFKSCASADFATEALRAHQYTPLATIIIRNNPAAILQ
jgi:hypothetical protein